MALYDDSRLGVATDETEQGVLSALAEAEALPKLFKSRNRSRNGNGACHCVYCMRCPAETSRTFGEGWISLVNPYPLPSLGRGLQAEVAGAIKVQ